MDLAAVRAVVSLLAALAAVQAVSLLAEALASAEELHHLVRLTIATITSAADLFSLPKP